MGLLPRCRRIHRGPGFRSKGLSGRQEPYSADRGAGFPGRPEPALLARKCRQPSVQSGSSGRSDDHPRLGRAIRHDIGRTATKCGGVEP